MKKIILIITSVVFILAFYILISIKNKNEILKTEINDLKEYQIEQEIKKEENIKKQEKLKILEEENKEKIEDYEEVEVWNREIINYLQ